MKGLNIFKNLQLFSEISDMARTTDSGVSAEMKTYYNTALLQKAKANLVFAQIGRKQALPLNNGKTIEWRIAGDFQKATTPLEEGVTPDGHKIDIPSITATIYQYGDYSRISDVIKKTAIDPIMKIYVDEHAANAKLTIDTLIRNVLATGTNVAYSPKSNGTAVTSRANLDATCNLTVKDVKRAKTILARKNAPKFGDSYIAVVHPDIILDLQNDDEWQKVHQYTDNKNMLNGEVGKLYGVRFLESTEAPIFGPTQAERDDAVSPDTSLAVYGTFFIAKDAYGIVSLEGKNMEMIIKQPDSGGAENPLNQRGSVGWKVNGFATKILHPDRLVRLESCSAVFSATAVAN